MGFQKISNKKTTKNSVNIETAKLALCGYKKEKEKFDLLKRKDPDSYLQIRSKALEELRKSELEYSTIIEPDVLEHYINQPFGPDPLRGSFHSSTTNLLRLFALFLDVLSLPQNAYILDVGVGSGWTSCFLAKAGYRVKGMDIAPKKLEIAKKKAAQWGVNVHFEIGDLEKTIYENCFDAILCYATLHHCFDEQLVLNNFYKALKTGGKVLLYEPCKTHHLDSIKEIKKYGVLEKGFSVRDLKSLLYSAGFERVYFYLEFPLTVKRSLIPVLREIKRLLWNKFTNYSSKGDQGNIVLAQKGKS